MSRALFRWVRKVVTENYCSRPAHNGQFPPIFSLERVLSPYIREKIGENSPLRAELLRVTTRTVSYFSGVVCFLTLKLRRIMICAGTPIVYRSHQLRSMNVRYTAVMMLHTNREIK